MKYFIFEMFSISELFRDFRFSYLGGEYWFGLDLDMSYDMSSQFVEEVFAHVEDVILDESE
jgi:hypothetical protein